MTSTAPTAPLLSRPSAAGVVVLLMHLVVAGLLWQMPAWGDRQAAAPAQQPLLVRLWWAQVPAQPAVPRVQVDRPRAVPPRGVPLQQQATPQPVEPQAITDPSATAPRATAESPAPAVVPPAAPDEATASKPLNLTLPRSASAPWRQRNPALDDPRANTAKLTLEQKLANAMGGDGTWVVERVDLNTIRYRRGNECVQLIRSRAGQLELGGGAFRNSWLAGNC